MKFVQLLLTDEQAELAAAALRDAEKALNDQLQGALATDDDGVEEATRAEADIAQIGRLSMLFQDASENPAKYPPTGKMAATVRTITRRAKGTPQPASRRRRRAGRHERRRALRHAFRRNREFTEGYNQAVESYEAEQAEAEQARAEIEARIEGQPKFTITDAFGQTIMSGIPAEFVVDEGGTSLFDRDQQKKLVVVGKTE